MRDMGDDPVRQRLLASTGVPDHSDLTFCSGIARSCGAHTSLLVANVHLIHAWYPPLIRLWTLAKQFTAQYPDRDARQCGLAHQR
jgi:hypothetical protein